MDKKSDIIKILYLYRPDRISVDELCNYKDDIKRMFYDDGFGANAIALKLGCNDKNFYMHSKKGSVKKIIKDILGFSNSNDYKKVNVRNKQKLRIIAGFDSKLKKKIRCRDYYRCTNCGSIKKLEVHHVDQDFKNNNIDNLITLCRDCHNKTHHHCLICGYDLSNILMSCPICSGELLKYLE